MGKKSSKINLSNVAGTEYEKIWELSKKDRKLVPVELTPDELFELWSPDDSIISSADPTPTGDTDPDVPGTSTADETTSSDMNDPRDNRNLVDDGKSQKLSRDEIESLKLTDMSDNQIIQNIIDNSSTFNSKTHFSQVKYIKKKKQKYSNHYIVTKPTVRLLCEMFYSCNPAKNIRSDTLSQILSSANIRSGGKFMVVDNPYGMVTAAILDRMIGDGTYYLQNDHHGSSEHPDITNAGLVIQIYLEQGPCSHWRSCLDALNLPHEITSKTVCSLQIKQLNDILVGRDVDKTEDHQEMIHSQKVDDHKSCDTLNPEREAKRRKMDERFKRRAERKLEEKIAKDVLMTKSLNGLIIMIRNHDPLGILNIMIEFLQPSSPFVVFSSNLEPLTQCLPFLKTKSINLRIHESFYRKYQVLPDRTRPDMCMSGSGGYLLTGIKVAPE